MSEDTVNEKGELDTGGVSIEERTFIEDAIVAAGGVVTDSGMGCGGADLGYTWNGRTFDLTIKSRETQQSEAA